MQLLGVRACERLLKEVHKKFHLCAHALHFTSKEKGGADVVLFLLPSIGKTNESNAAPLRCLSLDYLLGIKLCHGNIQSLLSGSGLRVKVPGRGKQAKHQEKKREAHPIPYFIYWLLYLESNVQHFLLFYVADVHE